MQTPTTAVRNTLDDNLDRALALAGHLSERLLARAQAEGDHELLAFAILAEQLDACLDRAHDAALVLGGTPLPWDVATGQIMR